MILADLNVRTRALGSAAATSFAMARDCVKPIRVYASRKGQRPFRLGSSAMLQLAFQQGTYS